MKYTILSIIALGALAMGQLASATSPVAVGSANAGGAYRLVALDGQATELRSEEGMVFDGDTIQTYNDTVFVETARAEKIAVGRNSAVRYSLDGTPKLIVAKGDVHVNAGSNAALAVEAGELTVRAADGASEGLFYVNTSGDKLFVRNYGADSLVIASNTGVLIETVAPKTSLTVSGSSATSFDVRMLQEEGDTAEDDDDTKRALPKTVYREMKPEFVVLEDEEKQQYLRPGETENDVDENILKQRKAEAYGWRLEEGLLESSPSVDSQPLPMEIPVKGLRLDQSEDETETDMTYEESLEGDDAEGTGWIGPHIVRAHVRTTQEFRGITEPAFSQPPLNSFSVQHEDDDEATVYYYDPSDENANYESDNPNTKWYDPDQDYDNDAMLDLGDIDLGNGVHNFVIDDEASPFWTSIYAFDYSPIGALFGGDEPVEDELAAATGDEAVAVEEDNDIAGWISGGGATTAAIILGGGAIIGGVAIINNNIGDDGGDDDDDDDFRRPVSPVQPAGNTGGNPMMPMMPGMPGGGADR